MARSKNNKKIKGGVWYDPSTWGSTKVEEVKKEETPLLNEPTSPVAPESSPSASPLEEPTKESSGLLSTPPADSSAPAEEKSWKNLWGLTGGKSKKAKKRKANKTKKSKK